ncbi:YheC/YheD family protein [Paenibacillus sp. 598K]|uniref:YheC/YheD family protein n=1 Tax=Paenibacillus sp. 598K TaxID=1117987 RepID=UPI0027D8EF58|nr:YheC/YheD family protein [Paenibacillus sp. 598K]
MPSLAIQRVVSKWSKTSVLLEDGSIAAHIPLTRKLSHESLLAMLKQYNMVYVKPDRGTFGIGVIRVETSGDGGYRYQEGTRVRTFASYDPMYHSLKQLIGNRTYLVQRGIHLLRHRKRRFDLRVMVQKSPSGAWESTGIIGRLAHPGKIVTNYHSGGTPMAFGELMATHLPTAEQPAYTTRLERLGERVARRLQRIYPGLKEIGIDVAIDTQLQPWILEVNTKPDPYIFRKLKDRSVFRKVYRYGMAYGRFRRK